MQVLCDGASRTWAGHTHAEQERWDMQNGSKKGTYSDKRASSCEDARARTVALECKHEIITDIGTYSASKCFYVKKPAIVTRILTKNGERRGKNMVDLC